jgi:predicted phosphohydrolase
MRLFAIGDTHLPSTREKDMHRFGWAEHPAPLQRAWDALVSPEDVVIVAGDISWATRPTEVQGDLAWLDARPGRKVLLRGNHDYWWGDSLTRLRKLLAPYPSLEGVIHNCAVEMGPWVIAGTRLWTTPEAPPMPGGEMGNEPVEAGFVERETHRLSLSIQDAEAKLRVNPTLRKVVAVHFPPLYAGGAPTAFSAVIEGWQPRHCVYGHLHAEGIAAGFQGVHGGVPYRLVSCDAAGFTPVLVDEA